MSQKKVRAEALRFTSGEISFTESENADSPVTEYDVRLLARSSGSIEHWYWGQQTIHDMSGMNVAAKIPIDFNHDTGEIIGYLDQFEESPEGLVASGKLVSFSEDDRAGDIARKAKAGIPWQASINFGGDGIRVENVSEGTEFSVNQKQFTGPATVIRSWPLRGVAITPYGADSSTESVVLSDKGNEFLVEVKETQMSDDAVQDAVEEEAVVATEEAVDESVEQPEADDHSEEQEVVAESPEQEQAEPADAQLSQAEGKRYIELFGADQGAVWFIEGKTINECFALKVATLTEENNSLREEVANLRTSDRGEDAPLSYSNEPAGDVSELQQRVKELKRQGIESDFVANMAASIETQLNS